VQNAIEILLYMESKRKILMKHCFVIYAVNDLYIIYIYNKFININNMFMILL